MSMPIWERQGNGSTKKVRVGAAVDKSIESMKAEIIKKMERGDQVEKIGAEDVAEYWKVCIPKEGKPAGEAYKYQKVRPACEETCDVPTPRQIPYVMINQGFMCLQEEVYELRKLASQLHGFDVPEPEVFEPAGCLFEALNTFPDRVELLSGQIAGATAELKGLLL